MPWDPGAEWDENEGYEDENEGYEDEGEEVRDTALVYYACSFFGVLCMLFFLYQQRS